MVEPAEKATTAESFETTTMVEPTEKATTAESFETTTEGAEAELEVQQEKINVPDFPGIDKMVDLPNLPDLDQLQDLLKETEKEKEREKEKETQLDQAIAPSEVAEVSEQEQEGTNVVAAAEDYGLPELPEISPEIKAEQGEAAESETGAAGQGEVAESETGAAGQGETGDSATEASSMSTEPAETSDHKNLMDLPQMPEFTDLPDLEEFEQLLKDHEIDMENIQDIDNKKNREATKKSDTTGKGSVEDTSESTSKDTDD